ncbi:hypothetical protein [Halalkalicoccus salilacus]|uniref:hypothetical protein n=1 Tax=Halalkalicoccus TaxID=332246 RepID=UPI002F96A53A
MANTEQSQIEGLVESLQNKTNATRRNLDSLGTMGVMDLGDTDVAFSDVILLFTSLMTFAILGNIVPDGRNWALLVLGISTVLVGGVLVGIRVSPPQMSFYKWLKCKIGFWFGSDHRAANTGDSGRITKDSVSSGGERRALEDLTRVDGFAPQADGVWRFDGALVGGVSIDPAELSLASKADWEAAADELGEVINGLEHAGQLRNGSVKIDTEAVKRRFGERIGDPDVRSNPQLQQNVGMYKQNLAAQMDSRNASIRGFQFLAPVTMEEVQMQGHRVLGRLDDIPVLGPRVASMLASRDLTVAEIRYRQERILKERRASLEKNLGGITGCDADQLSMDDLISVLEESWTGERVVTEERDDRSLPLVTMTREYTETKGDSRSPDQLADDELDQQILDELQKSAAPVEETSSADPDPDPGGASDLSDEDHERRTVSADDLNGAESEPETEPEPETPETPNTPESEAGTQDGMEPSIDESQYATLEEVCAALVEQMEQAESEAESEAETTDSSGGAERQEQKALD